MTADELKLRTKRFALRVIKLVAALPRQLRDEQLPTNSFAAARRSLQIIVPLVALALEVNSLRKWEWFLRRQMRLSCGSN
jgi:hypothetical protein